MADEGHTQREIAEVVASKQEKMLVFSQFREVTAPLDAYLGGVDAEAEEEQAFPVRGPLR